MPYALQLCEAEYAHGGLALAELIVDRDERLNGAWGDVAGTHFSLLVAERLFERRGMRSATQ